MNIDAKTAARALGKADYEFEVLCGIVWGISLKSGSITYEDYKKLVGCLLYSRDKFYELGTKIYYDNDRDDKLAIPLLEEADKRGETRAVGILAEAYAYGFGVEKNADKCVEYLQRGIDADSPFCYYLASKLMEKGEILVKDLEKSFRFMKIAADKNYMNAMLPLANKYLDGIGTQKDRQEGMRYLKIAAENGNEEAKKRLVELERTSHTDFPGLSEEERNALTRLIEDHLTPYANEAENEYRADADAGDLYAMYNLGLAYYKGDKAPKDYGEAVKWWRKAAEMNLVIAQANLAVCYGRGLGVSPNQTEATLWYLRAAEQGDVSSQYVMARRYEDGYGVDKNIQQSAKWYEKAANNGYAKAQYEIGRCYAAGYGVQKDLSRALAWWRKAAAQGLEEANVNIGIFYLYGTNVEKNYNIAFRLFHQAATHNVKRAYYSLGYLYEKGMGVRRNREKAAQLYNIAAKMGYAPANSKVSELKHYITNPWIELAQEIQREIIKEQIKDLLSDIVESALDKLLDEDGAYLAEPIAEGFADSFVDALFDN